MQGDQATMIVPLPLPTFTLDEWHLHNRHTRRSSEVPQELTDGILSESSRIRDFGSVLVAANKSETEHCLKTKLQDVENLKQELLRIRKEVLLEIDALVTAKDRLTNALSSVRKNALRICEKCLCIRERRIGIDLVCDSVELELRRECQLIKKLENVLVKSLEEAHEQIRRLKATLYCLDHDLNNKDDNLRIDRQNLNLKGISGRLNIYHGNTSLQPSTITLREWEMQSQKNILFAAKELTGTRPLRCYVTIILRQIIDDLKAQKNATDDALTTRINAITEAKTKLELQHSEVMRRVKEVKMNITDIEKSIAEKESYLALAHTRLGNRCQRPGLEHTRDLVEISLIREVYELQDIVTKLQQSLFEAQGMLRHLLRTQVQLEEDINVKVNSLEIDGVDCSTLHNAIDYHTDQ